MLEGLIQAYLDGFARGWTPRDEAPPRFRDSPSGQTALSSPESNQGEMSYAKKLDGR
ncbi:MAG: hypothetical protein AAF642_06990 [Pseudomonadota bacterium]